MSHWGIGGNDNGDWYGSDGGERVYEYYFAEIVGRGVKYHRINGNDLSIQPPSSSDGHVAWVAEVSDDGVIKAKVGDTHGWFFKEIASWKKTESLPKGFRLCGGFLVETSQQALAGFEAKIRKLGESGVNSSWAIVCSWLGISVKELAGIMKVDVGQSTNKYESDASFQLSLFDIKTCVELLDLCKEFDCSFEQSSNEFRSYMKRYSLNASFHDALRYS